jgi:hypothetical protein
LFPMACSIGVQIYIKCAAREAFVSRAQIGQYSTVSADFA